MGGTCGPRVGEEMFIGFQMGQFELKNRLEISESDRRVILRWICKKYRVSIKSFPDYEHFLHENYVEYKHMQL
jgi:hypothetical protein